MTKRARLDDDGRRVRQLELELVLARLRCQDDEDGSREESAAGGDGTAEPAPTPAPQTGPSSAPAASTQSTDAPTPLTTAQHTSRGRSRGRGARGARGGRFASLDNRGLQTVFVCVACDKIYCQACNAYEKSIDYWNRQ